MADAQSQQDSHASKASKASGSQNSKLHRRTKSGCLTCRKRRIKCGEERPICRNCTKSKRVCEGYTQRLTFRPPINWVTRLEYHGSALPGTKKPNTRQSPPPELDLTDAAFAAPPPFPTTQISPNSGGFAVNHHDHVVPYHLSTPMTPVFPATAGPYTNLMASGAPFYSHQPQFPPAVGHDFFQPPASAPQSANLTHQRLFSVPPAIGLGNVLTASNPITAEDLNDLPRQQIAKVEATRFQQYTMLDHMYPGTMQQSEHPDTLPPHVRQRVLEIEQQRSRQLSTILNANTSKDRFAENVAPVAQMWQQELPYHPQTSEQQQWYTNPNSANLAAAQANWMHPTMPMANMPGQIADSNRFLQDAAVETQDDEYFDVESEDDEYMLESSVSQDISLMMMIHEQANSDIAMRRIDAYLYDGVLDRYEPDYHASPLKNPLTARVFAHFISVTGPSLGIFERNPRNATAMFNDHRVPASQQSLWTYSLPSMALNNKGLLHAMLALSSLHIANLQAADKTPSLKHYMFAIKSVHKAVSDSTRRHKITTLAASLLLGYYEVMTADHAKWCSHLSGAKTLLVELDIPSLVRAATSQENLERAAGHGDVCRPPPTDLFRSAIDESLMATITGRQPPCFDEAGALITDAADVLSSGPGDAEAFLAARSQMGAPISHLPAKLDVQTFKLYQDLWWWFARQDAYQSIVSGNRLLMPYAKWSDCPPRAGVGRDDAAYGTHDHMVLLLGRIADFGAKDRKRKLAAAKASGRAWRPPPGGEFEGLGTVRAPAGMGGAGGQGGLSGYVGAISSGARRDERVMRWMDEVEEGGLEE